MSWPFGRTLTSNRDICRFGVAASWVRIESASLHGASVQGFGGEFLVKARAESDIVIKYRLLKDWVKNVR